MSFGGAGTARDSEVKHEDAGADGPRDAAVELDGTGPDSTPGDAGALCTPTESAESLCQDGVDNDCDGKIDCLDSQCQGMPCDDQDPGTLGDTCVAGVCLGEHCTPTQVTESSCRDGVDNDCDGQVDCADPHCNGAVCNDGNANTDNDSCRSLVCTGDPCTTVEVCDECGTGSCEDVLIDEDTPGCGCADTVAAPNCAVGTTYDVPCGGGYYCTYRREEITEPCNCHDECQ